MFVAARLPVVALLVLTPALLAEGRLTAGGVAGAVTYFIGYLEPGLRTLVEAVGSWVVQLGTALDRIEFHLVDPGDEPGADPVPEPVRRPARAELRVDGLTFGYGVNPVLRDLDLVVAPGCHLAVVGPSGIGKSTLAFLLAGLVAPQRGSVHLGGSPISRVPDADLRRLVAVIPQEAYVFAGTLRENLAYLAADADDAALIASASAVGLDGVLARLGGLDVAMVDRWCRAVKRGEAARRAGPGPPLSGANRAARRGHRASRPQPRRRAQKGRWPSARSRP